MVSDGHGNHHLRRRARFCGEATRGTAPAHALMSASTAPKSPSCHHDVIVSAPIVIELAGRQRGAARRHGNARPSSTAKARRHAWAFHRWAWRRRRVALSKPGRWQCRRPGLARAATATAALPVIAGRRYKRRRIGHHLGSAHGNGIYRRREKARSTCRRRLTASGDWRRVLAYWLAPGMQRRLPAIRNLEASSPRSSKRRAYAGAPCRDGARRRRRRARVNIEEVAADKMCTWRRGVSYWLK